MYEIVAQSSDFALLYDFESEVATLMFLGVYDYGESGECFEIVDKYAGVYEPTVGDLKDFCKKAIEDYLQAKHCTEEYIRQEIEEMTKSLDEISGGKQE